MSAQVPDEALFEGNLFAVTAVDGTGLFDPAAHGLEPLSTSTACQRGYVCRYAAIKRRLVLRELELGSEDSRLRLAVRNRSRTTGTCVGATRGWTFR